MTGDIVSLNRISYTKDKKSLLKLTNKDDVAGRKRSDNSRFLGAYCKNAR